MSSYKTAFIGCGQRARAHAHGVRADDRLQVAAVADVNDTAAKSLATDYGFSAATVYSDYKEMLRVERPEVVIASLWTPLHLPVFQDCANVGVRAVLSEKPMAPTWGECVQMAEIAEAKNVQLTFCHQRRYAAGNAAVREQIRSGRFGKIERMDLYSPANLLDCGTHTIDQAMSFNEESPVKWILGAVDTRKTISYFNVHAEAMAVGTIVFNNGVRAHLQTGGPDMDLWGGVRAIGSEGFVEVTWDGEVRRAVVYREPDWKFPQVVKSAEDQVMTAMVRDTIDCLTAGRTPPLSHRTALHVTEAIFALYESVKQNARIELPLQNVRDNPFLSMLAAGAFLHQTKPELAAV